MSTEQHEPGGKLDQNQFCCPVCLDLLKEPVAIPCGHSYCRRCIEDCWDQEDKNGQYSCPQCRDTFSPRPVLKRNTMLAELVEKLKRSGPQQPSAPLARAGPHDVACDFCSGAGPNKAAMSCLTCMASYCPAHLEPHRCVPVLKKHELVSVTTPLQEKMCEKHNKLVEVYCRTDRKCICHLCVIDEHKGHKTLSSASERAEEQKQLLNSQKKVKQRFQKRGKELKELLQVLKNFKSSIEPAEKTCDKIFDEMICSVQKRRGEAKQLIGAQREAAVARAEELQLQLETEMSEMKKRDNDLELLSRTDDHIHFIQTFQSLSTFGESADLPAVFFNPQHASFKPVTDCLFKLKDDMESLLKDAWPTVCARVSAIEAVSPVPKTRQKSLRRNSITVYVNFPQDDRRATEMRIVILGKTGVGKSSVANTILRENVFQIGVAGSSETSKCQSETRRVDGRDVTLIDTPGLLDTDRPEEKMKAEIVRCITECSPGPHAFIIVFRVEKFTEQEQEVINKINQYFSEEAFKYTTLLFTHGDNLDEEQTIEEYFHKNHLVRDLMKKCGGRCHVIDNKYWKNNQQDEYRSNQFQVKQLLETIHHMMEANKGSCFTNEVLQAVEELRQEEEEKIRKSPGNKTEEEIRKEAQRRAIRLSVNPMKEEIRQCGIL